MENEKRKIIAEKMCISENTVKTHTTHIFEKLGISDRAELFEMANKEYTAAKPHQINSNLVGDGAHTVPYKYKTDGRAQRRSPLKAPLCKRSWHEVTEGLP